MRPAVVTETSAAEILPRILPILNAVNGLRQGE